MKCVAIQYEDLTVVSMAITYKFVIHVFTLYKNKN